MKNALKTCLFTVLAATTLVGCGPKAEPTWTEQQQKTMSDNLYGLVLPYLNVEGLKVSWDSEYEQLTISGGKVDENVLANYASKFESAKGWSDMTVYPESGKPLQYSFEIEAQVENDYRVVWLAFCALNSKNEEAKSGKFYLQALDPYAYAYPEEEIDEFLQGSFTAITGLVEFESHHYYLDETHLECYAKGATSDDAGYSAQLTAAGWTVVNGKDSDGYYNAVSSDDMFSIAYLVIGNYLYIYFDATPVYPSDEAIARVFADYTVYGATPYSFPKFEVSGAKYQLCEDSWNLLYIMFESYESLGGMINVYNVTKEDMDQYAAKLEEDNWVVKTDVYGDYYAKKNTETGLYSISVVDYLEDYNYIELGFKLIPAEPYLASWPTEKIAESLTSYVTETLPAFEGQGAIGYQFEEGAVTVVLEEGKGQAALESYEATLVAAEFTKDDNDIYTSKNGQINASVKLTDLGDLVIEFSETPSAWNAERISSALSNLFDATDVVPEFVLEGATFRYSISGEEDAATFQIAVNLPEGTTGTDAVELYQGVLTEAEYVDGGEDSYGDKIFISPNDQFVVCAWASNWENDLIYIDIYVPEQSETSFPAAKINEAFGVENVFPEVESEGLTFFIDYDDAHYGMIYGEAEGETTEAVEAFATALETALTANGFTVDEMGYYNKTIGDCTASVGFEISEDDPTILGLEFYYYNESEVEPV